MAEGKAFLRVEMPRENVEPELEIEQQHRQVPRWACFRQESSWMLTEWAEVVKWGIDIVQRSSPQGTSSPQRETITFHREAGCLLPRPSELATPAETWAASPGDAAPLL